MSTAEKRPTPRQNAEHAVRERGHAAAVDGFLALVDGDDTDGELIHLLGGGAGAWAVTGGVGGPDYWLRVWGLRALLYVWDVRATARVVRALSDEAWRVREMAAKVCARHRLEEAVPALAGLHGDPVERVRRAGERALARITAS